VRGKLTIVPFRRLLAAACVVYAALAGTRRARAEQTAGASCQTLPCFDGPFDRRKLKQDEIIGRVVCKAGTDVGFDPQRRLAFCTTGWAMVLDGVPVAADAYTLFHPNGRVYQTTLAKPREFTLANGRTISCAAGHVVLSDDGRLEACALAAQLKGDVRARVKANVAFHPDGRLAGATLDRPLTAGGTTFAPETHIRWDTAGVVVGGMLPEAATVGGLRIVMEFRLYSDGKLREAELAEPARVQGHDFPRDAHLQFRADGSLERARYLEKKGFMIHGEEWRHTATVTYDRSGVETSHDVEHWQSEISEPQFMKKWRPR